MQCTGDGGVKSGQEFLEGFSVAALEHSQAVVVGDDDAASGIQLPEGDLPFCLDQCGDVGKAGDPIRVTRPLPFVANLVLTTSLVGTPLGDVSSRLNIGGSIVTVIDSGYALRSEGPTCRKFRHEHFPFMISSG